MVFLWRKCDKSSEIINISPKEMINIVGKTIYQIDNDGVVTNEYLSIAEAARSVGIDRKGISDVIKGSQKTAGGFYWKA